MSSEDSSELVMRTEDPTSMAMDSYVDLLADDVECANMIKFWTERRDQVRKRLAGILGENEIGTVNGQDAIRYEYQDRFNSTVFKKKYPNLYRAYVRPVTEEKFDSTLLKASRPELYREFQVRSMRVTYEPPGS